MPNAITTRPEEVQPVVPPSIEEVLATQTVIPPPIEEVLATSPTTTTTAPVKQPARIPLAQPSEPSLEPVVPPPIEEVLAAQAAQQNIDAARMPSPLTSILNSPPSVPQLAPQYGFFAGPAPKPGEIYNPADTFGEKAGRVIAALGPIGDALVMAGGSPEQRRMLLERRERDYARARQLQLDQMAQQERARQAALEQAMTLEKIRNMHRQQELNLLRLNKDLMQNPKQEPDKHIGTFTDENGIQTFVMQRRDGSTYNVPAGRIYRETKPASPSAGLMSSDPAVRARAIQALRTEKQIEQQFRPTDTGPAISKDAIAAAQGKLINIGLAKKQLADIEAAIDKLGPVDLTGVTPTGKAFDAAVSGLRQTFTAITRVPGLGSMSDYETRLTQAPLPGRGDLYREVMKQKTAQIRMMLDELESGYRSQLGGQAQPAPAPKPAPRSRSRRPASADEFLRKWGLSR